MAVLRMASPHKDARTGILYLNVRIPADLKRLSGRRIPLPVGDGQSSVKIGAQVVKVSLGTRDPAEGRARFAATHAALMAYWEAERRGPEPLTHKQRVAIAGLVRRYVTEHFDEDPGSPEVWKDVIRSNEYIRDGVGFVPNQQGDGPATPEELAEYRYGAALDAVLAERQIVLDPDDRQPLIAAVQRAMEEAAEVTLRRAEGDYGPDEQATRYPAYKAAAAVSVTASKWTFRGVVEAERDARARGTGGKPLRPDTVKKYLRVADDFSEHRSSPDMASLTAREVAGWVESMQAVGKWKNKTIKDRLFTLKTIVGYGIAQSHGDLLGGVNPAAAIRPPMVEAHPQGHFTHTLKEAHALLTATRLETKSETRWLPWLLAYSGARVEELTPLRKEDFKEVEGRSFFVIGAAGEGSVKNVSSMRTVPIHPDLVAEGLVAFVKMAKPGRLFPSRAQDNLREWAHRVVPKARDGFKPNHGWRHLFEDRCFGCGMGDRAVAYITGRSTGSSADGYGRSEARLPGLAREMDKFPSYLKDGS